ncbi:RrF2 family transcriptional regulator [Lysobacter brunescens]|uniref:RrF2 family transcriptional regulator n=1 Tax=Lysobacter brunescens TaxID=262323 RepID=A0ABW2YHH1_9GAMM
MLTMKAKYALRTMTALARSGDARVQARQLAERCRVPAKFLETILVELREAGFVQSRRGQHGGHALARAAEEIRIGDVIRAIDGPLAPVRCASVTAYEPCRDCPDPDACALRALMRETRDALSRVLDGRSLREFADADAALSPTTMEFA